MMYEVSINFYIEIKEHIKERFPREIFTCENTNCKNYKKSLSEYDSGNFCSNCGKKLDYLIVGEIVQTPDCFEFFGEHFGDEDMFTTWNDNDRFWFVNRHIEGVPNFSFEITGQKEMVLSDIDFKQELENFKSKELIKEIIEKLEEVYGKESFEVKIGLFPEYN